MDPESAWTRVAISVGLAVIGVVLGVADSWRSGFGPLFFASVLFGATWAARKGWLRLGPVPDLSVRSAAGVVVGALIFTVGMVLFEIAEGEDAAVIESASMGVSVMVLMFTLMVRPSAAE